MGFTKEGKKEQIARFPTPMDTADYIDAVRRALAEHCTPQDIDCIVVAMPGTIEHNIVMRMGNLPWERFDIVGELTKIYPSTPIYLENDANLGGLGEAHELGHGMKKSLYVTISTGIGSGFVVDGVIEPLLSDMEIGAIPLEYDGVIRPWESFGSGKAIAQSYGRLASDIDSVSDWNDISYRFALGFIALLPILRPDIVIIGGGVGIHYRKFEQQLIGHLNEHLPDYYIPKLIQAQHPDEAVVYGCYHYAITHLDT